MATTSSSHTPSQGLRCGDTMGHAPTFTLASRVATAATEAAVPAPRVANPALLLVCKPWPGAPLRRHQQRQHVQTAARKRRSRIHWLGGGMLPGQSLVDHHAHAVVSASRYTDSPNTMARAATAVTATTIVQRVRGSSVKEEATSGDKWSASVWACVRLPLVGTES